jgi:sugar phosphate permease
MVGVISFIGLIQSSQFGSTVGIFIRPVTEDFGWSRSAFVGAISLGTLFGGLASIVMGPALDRFGPRWIVSGAVLLVGGSMIALANVDNLWQFYIAMVVGRAAAMGALGLGLTVPIAKWFIRSRGRALALAGLGSRIGSAGTPFAVQAFIGGFGWRSGAFSLGLVTWFVGLVPALLFLRRQPEDMGLRPDGDPPEGEETASTAASSARSVPEVNFTVRQAARTRVFYLLLGISIAATMVSAGITTNLVAYLVDKSLDTDTAVAVVAVWALTGMIGLMFGGWVGDRMPVRFPLAVSFLLQAVSVLILVRATGPVTAYMYGVLAGISFASALTLLQLIIPAYFGRASLGAIRGATMPVMLGGNAVGPILAAVVFDLTGSYTPIFTAFIGVYVVMGVTVLLAKPPRMAHAGGA